MTQEEQVEIDIGYSDHSLSHTGITNKYTYQYGGSSNNEVTVTETKNPEELQGYMVCVHKPNNGNTIGNIKYKHSTTGLSGSGTHTTVTVYFWEWDLGYINPLLVKLGDEEKYYITMDGSSWNDSTYYFKEHGILGSLNERNCARNKAHHIDVSKTSIPYTCPSTGCYTPIIVNSGANFGTSTKHVHTISGDQEFKVGSIIHKGTRLKNISVSSSLKTLSVFYYSGDTSLSIPFVIELQKQRSDREDNEYEYFKNNGNEWISILAQEGTIDSQKLLEILQELTDKHFPSNAGKIAGGVFGSLTSGGAGTEAINFFLNPNWSITRQIIRLLTTRF